jgi:hypothetical protein
MMKDTHLVGLYAKVVPMPKSSRLLRQLDVTIITSILLGRTTSELLKLRLNLIRDTESLQSHLIMAILRSTLVRHLTSREMLLLAPVMKLMML